MRRKERRKTYYAVMTMIQKGTGDHFADVYYGGKEVMRDFEWGHIFYPLQHVRLGVCEYYTVSMVVEAKEAMRNLTQWARSAKAEGKEFTVKFINLD